LKIASFNVQNFKLGADAPAFFKAQKAKKIASIIHVNRYDIVALQEIQDDATVAELSRLSGYEYCHCQDLYEELNHADYLNRNNATFKAEYAFLWNPLNIELSKDIDLYKGISEQISKCLDEFIVGITLILMGLVCAKKQRNDEKKKCSVAKELLTSLGIGGLGAGAFFFKKAYVRDIIENTLRQSLRPPLIGIFKKRNSYENKELRLINLHALWDKGNNNVVDSAFSIRRKEVKFILSRIFSIVDSQRNGIGQTALTLAAGDFNMRLSQLEPILTDIGFIKDCEGRTIQVVQADPTTINVTNENEVAQGQPAEYSFCNDYDHFAFDDKIGEMLLATRRTIWGKKDFFIEEKPISDHSPVEIELEF